MGGAGRGPTVATGSVEITPDFSKFRAQVERNFRRSNLRTEIRKELEKAERTLSERMNSIGNKLSNAGTTLTRGVTLPIIGLGAVSLKTAIDFETAFAGVRKTVDGTEKEFAKLERGIRDMAVATGTGANQLAAIAEAAGALGIKTPDILKFVDVVNKLDVATDLTAESAANALGKLKNVLDLSVDDLDNLSSAVVDLGNTGSSTEPEIVALALRIASAGKNAGLSTSEILAFSAAIADAGIEAEAGGTAISKTFADIAIAVVEKGKDLKKFAKVAGVSAEEFVDAWEKDPAAATASFIDGLQRLRKEAGPGGVIKALKDLGINEVRQIRTLQTLSGAQTSVTDKIRQSAKAYKEATAAGDEFDKFQKTHGQQLAKVKTALTEVALELGQALLPVLKDSLPVLQEMTKFVASAVEQFRRLDEGTQRNIIKIALAIAALGPALRVAGPLFKLVGWLAKLRTAKVATGLAGDIAGIGSAAGTAAGTKGLGGLLLRLGKLARFATNPITISVVVSVFILKPVVEKAAKAVADAVKRAAGGLSPAEAALGPGNDPVKQVRDVVAQMRTAQLIGEKVAQAILKATEGLDLTEEQARRVKDGIAEIIEAARNGASVADLQNIIERIANTDLSNAKQQIKDLAKELKISVKEAQKVAAFGQLVVGGGFVRFHGGGQVLHKGGQVATMHAGGLRPDERLAKLQTGEFVMQRNAVRRVGLAAMQAINSGASALSASERPIEVPLYIDGREFARATGSYSSQEFEERRRSRG